MGIRVAQVYLMWRTGPITFASFVMFAFAARPPRPNESIVIPRLSSNVSYFAAGDEGAVGCIFLVDAMSPGIP